MALAPHTHTHTHNLNTSASASYPGAVDVSAEVLAREGQRRRQHRPRRLLRQEEARVGRRVDGAARAGRNHSGAHDGSGHGHGWRSHREEQGRAREEDERVKKADHCTAAALGGEKCTGDATRGVWPSGGGGSAVIIVTHTAAVKWRPPARPRVDKGEAGGGAGVKSALARRDLERPAWKRGRTRGSSRGNAGVSPETAPARRTGGQWLKQTCNGKAGVPPPTAGVAQRPASCAPPVRPLASPCWPHPGAAGRALQRRCGCVAVARRPLRMRGGGGRGGERETGGGDDARCKVRGSLPLRTWAVSFLLGGGVARGE